MGDEPGGEGGTQITKCSAECHAKTLVSCEELSAREEESARVRRRMGR